MGKCFHVEFVQTDRWTDGQTDRKTTVKLYAPDLSIQGHKKNSHLTEWNLTKGISIFFLLSTMFLEVFSLRV